MTLELFPLTWGVAAYRPDVLSPQIVQVLNDLAWFYFEFGTPPFILWTVIIAITVPQIPGVVRLVRAIVLSVREEPYVEAAIAAGASQATHLGSVFIDGTAGQVSGYRSYGQPPTWGVWNAYNRQPIILLEGISVASWTYGTATIRPSNNTVSSNITTFTGLPEELISLNFTQTITGGGLSLTTQIIASWSIGVGWNSTTAFSGQTGFGALRLDGGSLDGNNSSNANARYIAPPGIGINVATTLEITNGITNATVTYFGNQNNMLMTAFYRG